MKRTKLDKQIDAAFKMHFDRVPIPLMDIPKIYKQARLWVAKGQDLNQVMFNFASEYKRKNNESQTLA